jgi:hypothetical protein
MTQIKTIDKNGQISLGKEYAGESVLIDNIEPGVWVVKIGKFIPNNEQWLHQKDNLKKLDEALSWAANSQPSKTDLTELESKLLGEDN